MKLVINKCFGGFGLSQEAYKKMIEYGIPVTKFENGKDNEYGNTIFYEGTKDFFFEEYWEVWTRQYKNRSNEVLIKVVEELGERANGLFAKLEIVEIPDGIDYEIDDYDGVETIHEKHRSW